MRAEARRKATRLRSLLDTHTRWLAGIAARKRDLRVYFVDLEPTAKHALSELFEASDVFFAEDFAQFQLFSDAFAGFRVADCSSAHCVFLNFFYPVLEYFERDLTAAMASVTSRAGGRPLLLFTNWDRVPRFLGLRAIPFAIRFPRAFTESSHGSTRT